MKDTHKIIIVGLVISLIICCLSPFLASQNPDGLEKTAELVKAGEGTTFHQPPMPDYEIPGLGTIGSILALVIGTIIVFAIAYGVAIVAGKRKA